MLIRYVRMTFEEGKVEEFIEIFNQSKQLIKAMDGCLHLELQRDIHQPNIFMTYSCWISEKHLNDYRDSEVFKNTWAKTKIIFTEKPIVFSTQTIVKA